MRGLKFFLVFIWLLLGVVWIIEGTGPDLTFGVVMAFLLALHNLVEGLGE